MVKRFVKFVSLLFLFSLIFSIFSISLTSAFSFSGLFDKLTGKVPTGQIITLVNNPNYTDNSTYIGVDSCIESDYLNIFEKGWVKHKCANCDSYQILNEYCDSANSSKIYEYYCNGLLSGENKDGKPILRAYACPGAYNQKMPDGSIVNCEGICSNGLCLQITTPSLCRWNGKWVINGTSVNIENTSMINSSNISVSVPVSNFSVNIKNTSTINSSNISVSIPVSNFSVNLGFQSDKNQTEISSILSDGRKAKIIVTPQIASQKAIEEIGEIGFNITLKELGEGQEIKAVYFLQAEKKVKLFGFIDKKARIQVEVDAENDGEIISIKKPWWAFLARGI
jgi:hypothetical protein